MNKNYVIGDIHGYDDRLTSNLISAGLMTDNLNWCGENATLWFVGDYFDRGPDGISVIETVMRLQKQAEQVGGRVMALLGNHDLQLLAAHHFRHRASTGPGKTFLTDWQRNGGIANDLARLASRHIDWLNSLPMMVQEDERLFIHADSHVYTHYGETVEAVNDWFADLLTSEDTEAWDKVLSRFSEHKYFHQSAEGTVRAVNFLDQYGGRQIIHGHTPIMTITFQPNDKVTEPLIYADGLCMDVDGGMYKGGPGFVYELPPVYAFTPVI